MENIDFLPERIKVQRARRKRLIRVGYLLAVCVGALVLLGFSRQERVKAAQAELALLSERSGNVRRQLATLDFLQAQHADLLVKKRIDEELGSRVDALDVLAELGRMMPEGIAITSLNLEAVAVPAPAVGQAKTSASARPAPAGNAPRAKETLVNRVRLDLVGLAPTDVDVANFIGQLSASPLFEDVNMGYAKNTRIKDRSAREFKVSCFVIR